MSMEIFLVHVNVIPSILLAVICIVPLYNCTVPRRKVMCGTIPHLNMNATPRVYHFSLYSNSKNDIVSLVDNGIARGSNTYDFNGSLFLLFLLTPS